MCKNEEHELFEMNGVLTISANVLLTRWLIQMHIT